MGVRSDALDVKVPGDCSAGASALVVEVELGLSREPVSSASLGMSYPNPFPFSLTKVAPHEIITLGLFTLKPISIFVLLVIAPPSDQGFQFPDEFPILVHLNPPSIEGRQKFLLMGEA